MRRRVLAFLTAAVILGGMIGPAPSSAAHHHRPSWRVRAIRFESRDGHPGYSRAELIATAWRAAQRTHPIGGWRMVRCIIDRESGWYPPARNPRSSATGLLQIVDGTWASWFASYDGIRTQYRLGYDRTYPRNILLIGLRAMHDSLAPWGGGCG